MLEATSSYIGDRYNDLKAVKVRVQITFRSAVLTSPYTEEYSRTLDQLINSIYIIIV